MRPQVRGSCLLGLLVTGSSSNTLRPVSMPGCKASLVRLVANIVHLNNSAQLLALSLGCVQLVLNAVKVDTKQPLIREWALLATRNLCEDNLVVQEEIQKLKATQVVDTPELKKMGIKTELSEEGAMKVKRREKQ